MFLCVNKLWFLSFFLRPLPPPFHYLSHTHIDTLLSCHRDSSGSCHISHSGAIQQHGVHITSHPTHTYVHTHWTIANGHKHDLFPFVRCCQGQSRLKYPKPIHSEHQPLGNFLPFHKCYSWANTAVFQVKFPANNQTFIRVSPWFTSQSLLFARGGFGCRLLLIYKVHCWKILSLRSLHFILCNK